MVDRKVETRELYVIIDDTPEAAAEIIAEVRRLKPVWGIGSTPQDSQTSLQEAYGELKKLTEMANGDRVLVSQDALNRATALVTAAAQVAQAEALGKIAEALGDENVHFWLDRAQRGRQS